MSDSNTLRTKGGVTCADFIGRDQHNIRYGFEPQDVEHIIDHVLELLRVGGVFLPANDHLEALRIEHDSQSLTIQPGAVRQLSSMGSERAYLLSLTIDQEFQRWATRFVPLAGHMDIRQVIEGLPIAFTELIIPIGESSMQAQPTTRSLKDITEAMHSHGAFVVLGDPGAGKTTTLQKIAFDEARDRLEKKPGRIPLFIRLSQQGERDPYNFLQMEWERRIGTPFTEALQNGRVLILADGLNEIPRDRRGERLLAWMMFEQQYRGANQMIFSGREKDYDNQLNLPRVLVEPLDGPRIAEFLERHRAEGLAELLSDPATRLNELARNPLNLFVMVMVYLQGGKNLQMLANRGRLFEGFTGHLLGREQLWHPDSLSVDAKVNLFSSLAYEMQHKGSGTTISLEEIFQALPSKVMVMGEAVPVDANELLRFGRGATILDPRMLEEMRFYHHLLQEYFAARELLRRFNHGENLCSLWNVDCSAEGMAPAEVGEWDPLPEPPGTGWEVTTILACGLSRDPARFVEAVRQANPALAGRCLEEAGLSGIQPRRLGGLSIGLRVDHAFQPVWKSICVDLHTRLYNHSTHLRARLQAGEILGKLGDPRFEQRKINGVCLILPEMRQIPGGTYMVGSREDDPYSLDNERPQCPVELTAFSIGRWPVTNAEYACFIEAGGYQEPSFWEGDLAQRWLKGEEVSGGQFHTWLKFWKVLQSMGDKVRETLESIGSFSPDDVIYYEDFAKMSEEEAKASLCQSLSIKSVTFPLSGKTASTTILPNPA